MKHLYILLFVLPLIGFGQIKNYSSEDFSFSYPNSYITKKLNLSHDEPTVKLISKTESHLEVVIIKKLPQSIPNNTTTSFIQELNNMSLQQEILMFNQYMDLSDSESFGSFFSTDKKKIFNKDVFVSYGKHEVPNMNLINWKVTYLFNINNESCTIQFSSEKIDGSGGDSFQTFKNKVKDLKIILETIR